MNVLLCSTRRRHIDLKERPYSSEAQLSTKGSSRGLGARLTGREDEENTDQNDAAAKEQMPEAGMASLVDVEEN